MTRTDDPRLALLGRLLAESPVGVTTVPPDQAAERHVGDALTALSVVASYDGPIADVGSGGGVPGLVLAIALAPRPVTLVEATRRKAARLEELAALLELSHVDVVADRAESYGRAAGRDAFGVVTARALAPPAVAAELCLPLARPGGAAVLYTGAVDEAPLRAVASALAAELASIEHVPGTERRHLVVLRKLAGTPERFPRRPGVAARRPLA